MRGPQEAILEDIQQSWEQQGMMEEPVAAAVRQLRGERQWGQIKRTEWGDSEGLLTFTGKIYVPDWRDLRQCIISLHHDS